MHVSVFSERRRTGDLEVVVEFELLCTAKDWLIIWIFWICLITILCNTDIRIIQDINVCGRAAAEPVDSIEIKGGRERMISRIDIETLNAP